RTPLKYAALRVLLTAALGVLCGLWLPRALDLDPKLGAVGLTASAGVAGWVEFALLRRGVARRVGKADVPAGLLGRLWAAALGTGGGVRHGSPWVLAAVLAAACARQARKAATPPLATDAPQAAAGAAAEQDPEAGPPLSAQEQIAHALSRVTFGARPADRDRVSRIGVAAFLEEQLHPEQIAGGEVEEQLAKFPGLRRRSAALAQELARYRKQKKENKAGATATAVPSST